MEYAALTGKETVLDAYCGTGTIGMIAAPRAGKVIGVELNQQAVRDAVTGAKKNQISNIRFYQNDASEFMVQLAESGDPVDVVFMDPPRGGSTEAFMEAVLRLNPEKIVYISCNPVTFARDAAMLKSAFELRRLSSVDLFPHTPHLECCSLWLPRHEN